MRKGIKHKGNSLHQGAEKGRLKMINQEEIRDVSEPQIIGELESGLTFILNPDWVRNWEEDEIKTLEEQVTKSKAGGKQCLSQRKSSNK